MAKIDAGTTTTPGAGSDTLPAPGGSVPVAANLSLGRRVAWLTGNGIKQTILTLLPILVFMAAWQLVAISGLVPAAFFPDFGAIFTALVEMAVDGTLWRDLGGSLYRLLVSVAFGCVIGTAIGLGMGTNRRVEQALSPLLNFGLSVPGIALIPLAILWFGLSDLTIISILIYEATLVVALNAWTAVKSVDQKLIDAGRTMGARGLEMFTRILFPGALAGVIGGYRLAFSRAWRILVAGEMLAGVASGLGYRIFEARQFFQADVVYAGILVIGLVGLLLERVVLRSIERATIERWGSVRALR